MKCENKLISSSRLIVKKKKNLLKSVNTQGFIMYKPFVLFQRSLQWSCTRMMYIVFSYHKKEALIYELLPCAHCCRQDSLLATPMDALLFIDGENANEERLGESMECCL